MFACQRSVASAPTALAWPRVTRSNWWVAVSAVGLLLGTASAQAQDVEAPPAAVRAADVQYAVALPAAPLADSLNRLATQTGALLSVDGALTAGKQAAALAGQMSVAQALQALLRGSGLYARDLGGRYVIQPVPELAPGVASLAAVEVYGALPSPKDEAYRAPQSVNVLTRDDIERFRGTSVGDIFQGIPGVLIGENRNSGGLDVNIRGMQGQGRVPVLIDGARQETTVSRGYAGVASRSYVDPDLLGGLTIEKGPSMSAQGTGAVGGLVMARTLNASDVVRDGETFGIRVRASAIGNNSGSPVSEGTTAGYFVRDGEYRTDCAPGSEMNCAGSNDLASMVGASGDSTLDRPGPYKPKSWAGSVALGLRLDHVDLVAAYASRRQGNYYAGTHGPAPSVDMSQTAPGMFGLWTSVYPTMSGASRFRAGELVVNSNYESRSSLLKAQFHLPHDQELELSWMRYHSEYGELMPSQLMWFGYIAQTANSEVTANTYTGRYRWQPVDNPWLDVSTNLWHTDTRSINRAYADATGSDGFWQNFASAGEEHYRRTGVDVSNSMAFDLAGSMVLRYGAALQKERVGNEDRGGTGRDGERDEYSGFVALTYQPVPSVTLDAGLRYTRYSAQDHNPTLQCEYDWQTNANGSLSSVARCEESLMDKVRHSGSAPVVSLAWEFLPDWQVYGRYAEALRMPSLFENTGGQSVTMVSGNLAPEHARNKEVGLSLVRDGVFGADDALRLKFSYFRNDMKDYLTRTLLNASEQSGGTGGFVMRNVDSARFQGFEVSGSYDAGMAFMEFGVSRYNVIEVCHRGSFRREVCTDYGIAASYVNNMIPPKWNGSLTLGTRWLDRRLTLGMRGTFMGPRTQLPEYDNQGVDTVFARPVEWHKYKIFDVFASYRFNDNVSVDFNIDNVTDRYYLDALGLGPVPAPGRTARLGVTLQF